MSSSRPVLSGRPVAGRLVVPSSKSISQRYLNLALLERMELLIRRPLLSEDILHYLEAFESLGFGVERGASEVRIVPGPPPAGDAPIEVFCGAGGTMFRFLTAALTAIPGRFVLDGIPRLRERTVAPLVEALRQLGAEIACPREEGFAPLEIRGQSLDGGRAVLDAGISSQFLSAVLMAGLKARREVTVEVAALTSEPYVDLTLDAIAELGGTVERQGKVWRVVPGRLAAEAVAVEGDFSAAAYPAAAAALTGGHVELLGLRRGSRQGDRGFVDLLERMGAEVRWYDDRLEVRGRGLEAIDVDLGAMPDQVPTLAALAPFARGTTRIRNVAQLRIKESDRLHAMSQELRRVGAEVEELHDGLVVPGVWAEAEPPSHPVEVETHGDHRIAMSLALVGLRRPGVVIRDPRVVAKSYPEFWDDLEDLL